MDEPRPSGIKLTRPSGVTEAKQVLLGELFLPVARIAGAAAGIGFGALGVAEIVKTFRPEDTAAEAGWRLVYAGLERAIEDIVQPFRHRATSAKSLPIEHLMQRGGGRIDFESIEAPANFLDQPKALPLLDQIKPLLEAALVYLEVDEAAARSAADRLPGYFVLALEATWRDHKAGLAAIEDLTRSPIALAARQERHWPYYRAVLEHELEQPLFAGDFSLRQLYQPLRGYWAERRDDTARGAGQEVRHVVDLATAFDAWLDTFDKDDALRVVTGGPGSGKSSFVKWWAARVLHRDPLLPTLVVPLHRLDSFDLEQEVWEHAQLHGFAKNPLAIDGGERRLLLILDGLDELDTDHKTGREAASALVTRVDRLLERNRRGHELRVVIAGRELIVSALRGELDRERQVFHVLGYSPRRATNHWDDPGKLLDGDQRQAWWRAWGRLTDETLDDVPPAIAHNKQLAELTDQPLLNHLLAVTRAAEPEALGEQSSINTVYASMLDHVWQRSWGDQQLPGLKPLSKEDFRRLFESIGLAVWQYGGGRTTTLEIVAGIAEREKLGAQLEVMADGAKNHALDLLTAFYFRRDAAAETFELTHKSFGEYFAAMRLSRLIESLHRLAEDPEFEAAEGLRRWYRWTYAARITIEIKGFLVRGLAALTLAEVSARRATLIRLFDRNLQTGMALATVDGAAPPRHYREAQRFDADAELALLAAIGACSEVLINGSECKPVEERRALVQWSPAWPDRAQDQRTSAWDLLRRLEAGTAFDSIVRGCMHGMDLDAQILRTDLSVAGWSFATAKSADLTHTNLSDADLSDADLTDASLTRADLSDASLTHAHLSDANLRGAHLTRADLSDASLTHAHLSDANLRGAHLNGAHLTHASLTHAHLSDANLIDADLTGADLTRAHLTDADLTDANLTRAHLTSAHLSDANLTRADLTDAHLRGANLSDVHGLTRKQLDAARNVDWERVPADLPDG